MPKAPGRRRFPYSPEIVATAHFANGAFREEYKKYLDGIRNLSLEDILNSRGVAGQLRRKFQKKYPHFSEEMLNYTSGSVVVIPFQNPYCDPQFLDGIRRSLIKSEDVNKPDFTLHLFTDPLPAHQTRDEGMPPCSPRFDDKEVMATHPVSDTIPSRRRSTGRYLRVQINLGHPWKSLKKELLGVLVAYRKELLLKAQTTGRKREAELIEYLRLSSLYDRAKENGVKPQTLYDPKKFRKLTQQNRKEWDDLTKKISTSRKRVKELFLELGLSSL